MKKQNKDPLNSGNEKLKDAQHLAGIGCWYWDIEQNIITWSDELYHINGYDRSKPVPPFEQMSSFYTSESWTLLCASVEHTFKTGDPYLLELKMIRPDGSWFYAETHGNTERNANGKIIKLYGTVKDISERKKNEIELKEKTDFANSIIDSSAISIWIADKNGTAIKANQACLNFFGATPEEVVGKYNLFKDEIIEQQGFMPQLRHVFEKGAIADIIVDYNFKAVKHVEVKNATHKIVHSIFTPVLDIYNQVKYVIVQSIDMTDIKKAEKALTESNERYKLITEKMHDVVWLMDLGGKSLYVSPSIVQFTGFSVDEYLQQTIDDRFTKDSAVKGKLFMQDCIREYFKNPVKMKIFSATLELEYICKDGQLKWGEMIVTPYFGQDDKLIGIHGATRDITDRKYMENNINQLLSNLQIKNSELEKFTYTVSHDLKAPLITIKGFAGMLAVDTKNGDVQRVAEDLERINIAAEKMKNLLDDLLSLSRIGRMKNESTEINMEELINEVVENSRIQINERNVKVSVAPNLPVIYGDKVRIGEVYQNLLENAIKYSAGQNEPQITIGYLTKADELIIFVKDNGIGIEPAYLSRVFELFEKIDPASEGTGVGLAIVKKIVESHGGRVWIESEGLGKGSTVFVAFKNKII